MNYLFYAAITWGLLLVGILSFHSLIWRRRRAFQNSSGRAFPEPRPGFLQFGNVLPIFKKGMLEVYDRWNHRFGGRDFVIWAGAVPHVVVCRPDTVSEIIRQPSIFVRDERPTIHLFGGSLIRLGGGAWRKRRNLLAPSFHPESLEHVVEVIKNEFAHLVEEWRLKTGKPFSPVKDISFRMLRVLGLSIFDFSFDRREHSGGVLHRSLIALSTDPVFRHFLPFFVVDLFHLKQVRAARAQMDALGRDILQASSTSNTPFMKALREGLTSGELDEPTLIDEIRTFLIAGHETSATALSWTLAMLALHPKVQQRVRTEVLAAGALTELSDLAKLPYMTCVIRETMRLFPPVPISIYRTAEATEISGHPVPAGTCVDLCSYVLHRSPSLWTDPEKFAPERFEVKGDVSPFQYFPFLMGAHTCIGMRLAMAELPLAVAATVTAYKLSAPEGPPVVNLRLSLHPAKFRLRLELI